MLKENLIIILFLFMLCGCTNNVSTEIETYDHRCIDTPNNITLEHTLFPDSVIKMTDVVRPFSLSELACYDKMYYFKSDEPDKITQVKTSLFALARWTGSNTEFDLDGADTSKCKYNVERSYYIYNGTKILYVEKRIEEINNCTSAPINYTFVITKNER